MNICKVWDAEYPWDIRVSKICHTLTDAGHKVDLVARNRDGRPTYEELPECSVHRMPTLPLIGGRLSAVTMFPAFFNPRWVRAIRRTVKRCASDLILVRDLPLAPTAIFVGRQCEVPVVLDMAENYPAMIRDIWISRKNKLHDVLVRNPSIVEMVERWSIARLDHIIVVVDESRDRLLGLGVEEHRITIVSNTPRESARPALSPDGHLHATEHLELVYLGQLEIPRGLGTVIDGVRQCLDAGMSVRLTVVGDGRDRGVFEKQVADQGLPPDTVVFRGFLEHGEALRAVGQAHVGIISHHTNESCQTTIPNKLFDYMAAGLAVVSSDCIPIKRILEETGCGVTFEDRSSASFVQAMKSVIDPRSRRNMAEAGQRWIQTKYCWEQDGERLLTCLTQVGEQGFPHTHTRGLP